MRADLNARLSTKRTARKPRGQAERRGKFSDVFTISQRPAEAADRAVPGHWEGDLILGTRGASAIGTLVERTTRFTILLHLPEDHTAESVAAAMIEAMSALPAHLRRTITWDRAAKWPTGVTSICNCRRRSTSAIPFTLATRHEREHCECWRWPGRG